MLNLTKGQKLNLTKDTGLTKAVVGLGWKLTAAGLRETVPVDCDAMAFMCVNTSGKPVCPREDYFCFFDPSHRSTIDGAVALSGDDRDGGDGVNPDEVINIDFDKVSKLAPEVTEISILVNIYEGITRKHNFGLLETAFLRISKPSGEVICNYKLDADFAAATSVQIGSFVKDASGHWVFEAVGVGFTKTLGEIVEVYGLS